MWNSLIGTPFCVYCGVRQGGVLSPLLFAIHVDDLISELRQSGYGLHIGSLFIGSILLVQSIYGKKHLNPKKLLQKVFLIHSVRFWCTL